MIFISFFAGIIPPLVWLWFWLKEDKLHPEPKKYIFYTFIAGMMTALLAIPLQQIIIDNTIKYGFVSMLLLASSEEILKYIFAYFTALKKKITDEPIDAVIYMITIALGFSALENSLYLLSIFQNGEILQGVILSNMRFIGATVLHTASSAIIGAAIALAFYKPKHIKRLFLSTGIILSITLHTSFNLFIINNKTGNIFGIFIFIWVIMAILLVVFEKIKKLKLKTYKTNL